MGAVFGPCDIIAEVKAAELDQITHILRHQIRVIPGVRNTLTCVTIT